MVFALFVRVLSPSETVTIVVGCDGDGDGDIVRLPDCVREYMVERYTPFIPDKRHGTLRERLMFSNRHVY